jgi:tRNA A-37 threonylcarbamoyl transferase component Bud32
MQQEIWFQKYRIISLLGRGGTAKVYLAEHIKLNSYRAIKCISKKHPLYELQRNEALILKNLKHSCIPIIYDIEEDEEGSYIVEQYLEGDTLKDYVITNGTLREDIILQLAIQLCDLIHYLHSNSRPILYVDLKPDNIILTGRTLKLIDFGSAIYQDELSEQQNYFGTRGYAAPELYLHKQIDERCDVYGIGMLIYYMTTGLIIRKDNAGIDNIDQIGNCSKRLKQIINHCLKFNPAQRYTSVAQLNKQLSAMIRKNRLPYESSQSLTIAVTGAQHRIGVTHLALRLSNYFIQQNQKCLYQEKNNSGCVWSIKNCYEEVKVMDGIYEIEGIPMLPYNQNGQIHASEFQIKIQDYGCLTKENLSEFLSADIKLLVLGAKDWELESAEQVLNCLAEYKDIAYLFNFMNGRQFQEVMKSMERKNSFRVPYEPDPFARITDRNGLELFHELLRPWKRVSLREKAAKVLHRRKEYHET